MENKSFDELKEEATDLGLDFGGIKSKKGLIDLIEKHYESQSAGDLVQEAQDEEDEEVEVETPVAKVGKETPQQKFMRESKERRQKRMKTRVVTISNNDKRDNHVTSTAFLSNGLIQRVVPLDTPVELQDCLIQIAKDVEIILHVDEVKNGHRTGNKVPKLVKKYSVSYEDMKPTED